MNLNTVMLLTRITDNSGLWINITWVLIGLFSIVAIVLSLMQLRQRRKYDPFSLKEEMVKFAQESKVSDEKVLLDYADTYFSRSLLVYDEIIRFLLSSLTILGLLGTFIGLAMLIVPKFEHLSKILSSGNYSDLAFKDTFGQIISGFKTAFYTSIAGIILALILSLIYHLLRQNIKAIRSEFIKLHLPSVIAEIKRDAVAYDPVQFFREIERYFVDGLKNFGLEIADSHKELKQWAESVVMSNTAMVKGYVEANNTRIQAVTEELSKEYSALQKVSKDSYRISNILGSLVDKLDSFADVIRNYDKTYDNLLDTIENFSLEFGNLFSRIQTVIDTTTQPSQLLSNLYTALETMVNNQQKIQSSNESLLQGFSTSFEELLAKSAEQDKTSNSNLQHTMTEIMKEMQQILSEESLKRMLDPRFELMKKALEAVQYSIEELNDKELNNAKYDEMIKNLETISKSISNGPDVGEDIRRVESHLEKVNRNLGKVFEALEF